jgi:hypothetical protein
MKDEMEGEVEEREKEREQSGIMGEEEPNRTPPEPNPTESFFQRNSTSIILCDLSFKSS